MGGRHRGSCGVRPGRGREQHESGDDWSSSPSAHERSVVCVVVDPDLQHTVFPLINA
jgi:hypothetical protein